MGKKAVVKQMNIWSAIGALVVLIVFIFFSPNQFISDEPCFINNLTLLQKLGLGKGFLTQMSHQSPGPLYNVVLAAANVFFPITPLSMRLINGLVFLLLIGITFFFFRKKDGEESLNNALLYFSVPPLWGLAGVGLSEMPAMLFLTVGLLLLYHSMSSKNSSSYWLALLSGLCVSLSILGRTQFLVLLFVTPILLLQRDKRRQIVLFLIAASALPLYVFSLWKGLMPPAAQHIQSGTVWMNGFLALGYLAIITLLICYRWFAIPRRFYYLCAALLVLICIANVTGHFVAYEPLLTVIRKLHINSFLPVYKYLAPGVIIGGGIFFLIASCYRLWENRKDIWFVFLFLIGLALIASCIKITWVFSSRYVAQTIPVFLIPYARYTTNNYTSWLLRIMGILLGIAGLWSYYHYS